MKKRKPFTDRQLSDICQGLSLQLHAGISLADGIYLLAEDETDAVSAVLRQVGASLDKGATLAQALEETGCFPEYVWGMVQIGQQTGKLEQTLDSLGAFYERQHSRKRHIRQALGYPAMVFGLMLVVVAVLLIRVLPVFDGVYASLGSHMTGIAGWLLRLGQILKAALPYLALLPVFGGIFALCAWKNPELGNRISGRYQSRMGDRGIGRKFNNARFSQALALGLSSGLPLEEAMTSARALLGNVPGAADRCRLCQEQLASGAALPEAMKQAQLLPPTEARMLAAGVCSGNADRVMEEIARRLQQQAEEALEDAVAGIEPTLVLVAALLVGMILLSVMLPLVDIMSTIG